MRWVRHVAWMSMRNANKILVGEPEGESDHSEDLGKDGRTILK
jgi:hypothetical protein